ncbi:MULTISPECIES: PhzF family phenazine biosynthesis protein [unclassified Pigmentiphaga]|uniref:PhzF family phenazine biosynthesis protein n=1 Tax=unclassified Pigmentiphaga TaxID=2626614 RepID=UPI000B40A792|nr:MULTISPECIES: PhzF family phenazine biosynthesis protein [unclassified Pigmentiphaga]OVZ61519.1 phenazine biosynthesis protein PhzF [Pigmentiphaga sp. NML030171]
MTTPLPSLHDFSQVDVFTAVPLQGNPLAVVHGADDLDETRMAALARWTGLSETTFLLRPTQDGADYRVRIFTPAGELPFAGHPTLGSCHAWLRAGGQPRGADIVQECGVGLVRIRRTQGRLAFAAPPLRRAGDVDPATLAQAARGLGIAPDVIRAANWVDNGPAWMAVMLATRAQVLALKPDHAAMGTLKIGVVAPWDPALDGTEAQFEVRAFAPGLGVPEDPVTGSLNAGIAQWLIGAGLAPGRYVASQGTALGRAGRVHVSREEDDIWVGGDVADCIEGRILL